MDWIQALTIIFSMAGLFFWFANKVDSDIKNLSNKVDSDIKKLDSDIKNLANKVDSDIKNLANKVEADTRAHSARTDKLYEMFIQIQKENNDLIQAFLRKNP